MGNAGAAALPVSGAAAPPGDADPSPPVGERAFSL